MLALNKTKVSDLGPLGPLVIFLLGWYVVCEKELSQIAKKLGKSQSGVRESVIYTCIFSIFRFIKLSSGILQLINVQEGDTGSYRCHATQGSLHELPEEVDNIYGKTSAEAFLEVYKGENLTTPPDKSAYLKIIFLFSQPKHMFKLMIKKIITILRNLFLLNWSYINPFDINGFFLILAWVEC